MKGIIKFYKQQGYGFIAAEDNKDYFFHISDVEQPYKLDIKNGQVVTFVPFETRRGFSARSIALLQQDEPKKADDYLLEIDETKKRVFNKTIEKICICICLVINFLLFITFQMPKIVLLLSIFLLITLLSLIYFKKNSKK
ncbi:cold-shock protein [Enterocloster citroniae]